MLLQVSGTRPVPVGILAVLAVGIFAADLYGVTTVATGETGSGTGPAAAAPVAPQAAAQLPGSLVASGNGPYVDVYASRNAPYPVVRMPNPWLLSGGTARIPQVFQVVGRPASGWARVVLPMRPDGLEGWVRTGQVRILSDPWRIDVSLRAHVVFIHRGADLVYQGPVATGAAATPTPAGDYYIRVLLHSTDPASPYGPYAYGLSGDANDALTTFTGADTEIGLQGNDDPASLGRAATHGAVRMDDAELTALAGVLPLGTPVHVGA
jgi:lipoprotein-anchoring transpeptidase ErfK/SrfK